MPNLSVLADSDYGSEASKAEIADQPYYQDKPHTEKDENLNSLNNLDETPLIILDALFMFIIIIILILVICYFYCKNKNRTKEEP